MSLSSRVDSLAARSFATQQALFNAAREVTRIAERQDDLDEELATALREMLVAIAEQSRTLKVVLEEAVAVSA